MRVLALCITLLYLSVHSASGSEVLILQSQRSATYRKTLRGFQAGLGLRGHTVVLSDYAETDVVRLVREERPRAVLALGDRALAAARKVRGVPVVAALSLEFTFRGSAAENIGGIGIVAGPEPYLRVFSSLGTRRVAVLYDPSKSGRYVRRAVREARQMGLTLVTEQVTSPLELQSKLARMIGSIDAVWLLPDSTVVTSVNMEAVILYSISYNLPIVTFSSDHLKIGAAAALEVDYYDIGEQAAEMVRTLLEGGQPCRVPTVDPRITPLSINESVIRKAGKRFPSTAH